MSFLFTKNLRREYDARKKQYAIDKEINLLPIWYWDYKNIKTILDKELLDNKLNKIRKEGIICL